MAVLLVAAASLGKTQVRYVSGLTPRSRQVHAERQTMPNEGRPMRENVSTRVFAIVAGISFTRHSPALHRAWRNCSKRSGGRYRPLGRPFKIGTFASAASLSAI